MEKIEIVLEAFANAVEHGKKKYRDRIERMERAWEESNSGLKPNQDRLGRWHSPCNGYTLAENLDFPDSVDYDKKYRKGEFLPTPIDYNSDIAHMAESKSMRMFNKFRSQEKIKVELELAEQIVKELEHNSVIEFSHGSSWSVNGIEICYLYLKAHVENVFKYFYDAVKSAIENTDKHVYTGSAYEGRQLVKGKIARASIETVVDYSGYSSTTEIIKLFIVLDNDSTCFGNFPSSVIINGHKQYFCGSCEDLRGVEVEFTATFTKAKNSDHHAYYKRPHKMNLTFKEEE